MDNPLLRQGMIMLLLAAASYTVGHGARLLMLRQRWPVWLAGTLFGFGAFIVSRCTLAAAAWLVYTTLFGPGRELWVLIALVGVASAPLLLAFVHLTPFFGPGVLRVLYFISLIWLTSTTSSELNMDWLGCLGWWAAAWLLASGASFALAQVFRSAHWLAWTGILGPYHTTPQAVMVEMPGMKDAVWER